MQQSPRELYERPNRLARLVGAVAMAKRGTLPDLNLLTVTLDNETDDEEEWSDVYGPLAVIALGHTKDRRAIPSLLQMLERRPAGYENHGCACEALAEIGDVAAVPVLYECLRDSDFRALPEAFCALVTLGDLKVAIQLAIARVTPEIKGYQSGRLVDELERVTGQRLGYDPAAWEAWWRSNRPTG